MSEEKDTGPEQTTGRLSTEEVKVQAKDVLKTVNEAIRKGRVRRVQVIRKGRILVDIPLVAGVAAGAVLVLYLPVLTAIVAAGALLGGCTVHIEREEPKAD